MGPRTTHYQLNELVAGGSLADDQYKFGGADRVTIDQKLWLGAEGHHHTGAAILDPGVGPSLTVTTGGALAAGTRYYYRYSLVDASGNESLGSAETYIDTPAALTAPSAPILSTSPTGGTLTGGNYTYYLTVYQGDTRDETLAGLPGFVSVAAGTTSTVTITFPSLPSGATGFNIYRRSPNGAIAEFIVAVPLNVATPPTQYVDDGSVDGDCDRTLPLTNRTSSDAAVIISVPGATPVVPVGFTWKIYRTTTSGQYGASFLKHVVEYTNEATPKVIPYYTDLGGSVGAGAPAEESTSSPSKILLTNGAEVQGELPGSNIAWFPLSLVFSFGGTLQLQDGVFLWYNEFETARIVSVRPILGVESTPATQPVMIDIRRGNGPVCPTLDSLWVNPANRPVVEVGYQYGLAFVPDFPNLVAGDLLTCDIVQTGGGATPTDRNLTVVITLRVKFA